MNKVLYKTIIAVTALASMALTSCSKQGRGQEISVAVFLPGIIADSPTYAHVAQGAEEAAKEHNAGASGGRKVSLHIMEAGTNQAEWATKLTALTATGKYDLIISSNPSMPEIALPLTDRFPEQKFIFLDGALEGNPNIACISYNQKEQTYLSGYISGLMSRTHKVAVVAAQEYPVMNNILYPYYARGAQDAAGGTTCDFRVVGNWYDASKGAEITDALAASGVDVIMPICGGASQGVISSAKEHGIYLAYIDENSFAKAPGTVISSCSTKQETATKEALLDFLDGKTEWGTTKVVGLQEGYIDFIETDPLYESTVPLQIRDKMSALVEGLRNGSIKVPEL